MIRGKMHYYLSNEPNEISIVFFVTKVCSMNRHTLKNGNDCLNTYIYSYLETSGSPSSKL